MQGPRYYSVLLRGLLVLYGLPALALLLHSALGLGAALGLTLVACLPAAMSLRDYAGAGLVLAFCGFGLAGFTCTSLEESQRISNGTRLENVSVNDAAQNHQATVFQFSEAEIHRNLSSELKFRIGGKKKQTVTYYLAPLTNSDWTAENPVRAWVMASSFEATQEWRKNHLTGVRRESNSDPSHLKAAIRKAESRHGLTSAPEPLILTWGNPEAMYQKSLARLKQVYPLVSLLWFLGLSIHWLKKRWSNSSRLRP